MRHRRAFGRIVGSVVGLTQDGVVGGGLRDEGWASIGSGAILVLKRRAHCMLIPSHPRLQ